MDVLHLDAGKEMRGGQWQVLSLLEGLGSGHTLMTPSEGPLMLAARERGIAVEPMSLTSIASATRGAGLIHAHCARSHTWAAAFASAPLVVSRRVAFPVRASILSRWKYGRPRRFLAVSDFVRRTLMEAEIPAERISVVYDGVRIPDGVSAGTRILAPASDDPMKGADLVREAAALAGYRIEFSSDLARDLPDAGLLVYITRSEGLGSAALLAMAHGVPVVASRVGGLPEIVEDGISGVLTDNRPEAIAEAIMRALADREQLAANARRRVEERFSLAHMIEQTREAYRQVLE
ncbi:MAG: glycosyltransferase family 4 protein [Bryobacteraceae bacterium]|nr:glycosyltransferase family 4 protein [Bryobacteraceae bacterium]